MVSSEAGVNGDDVLVLNAPHGHRVVVELVVSLVLLSPAFVTAVIAESTRAGVGTAAVVALCVVAVHAVARSLGSIYEVEFASASIRKRSWLEVLLREAGTVREADYTTASLVRDESGNLCLNGESIARVGAADFDVMVSTLRPREAIDRRDGPRPTTRRPHSLAWRYLFVALLDVWYIGFVAALRGFPSPSTAATLTPVLAISFAVLVAIAIARHLKRGLTTVFRRP